jgi:short-subunit dehydrogenase
VLGFTAAVAQELRDDYVRVYAVCPGMTATDMTNDQGMEPVRVGQRIIDTAMERLDLLVGEDTEVYN